MFAIQLVAALLLVLLSVALAVRRLYPLPRLEGRSSSAHFIDTGETALGRGVAALVDGKGELSGLRLLVDGRDAFAARFLLARSAERSLDIQYYIWRDDLSGTLMLEAVREAAERGVRVRMLLDDNGLAGLDPILAALDLHPNIEIRLFNPFVLRRPKVLGYLADFLRLNRRMHNKSFTADNQVTIIGGRNIGDEYFGARDEGLFVDLDVLAIGPVVPHVSCDFDRYWSSRSSYPVARILPPVSEHERERLTREAGSVDDQPEGQAYLEAIRSQGFVDEIVAGTLDLEWARVRMVSDDPAKGIGEVHNAKLLAPALSDAIGQPREKVRLVSGYFVPTKAGVDAFSALGRRGVDIAVLTNAFEATDVWIVHAGYAHRRKALLRAGIRLFEMRYADDAGERGRRKLIGTGSGSGSSAAPKGPVLRSSGTTLHAKTFAVDGRRLFVGSFNFDPRSMHLNTELGFVIESQKLATTLSDLFETAIPARAYEVRLDDDGRIVWHEDTGEEIVVHQSEPGTSAAQRWGIRLLSRLPIEWLL